MQRAYGWAEEGGQVVVTSGIESTTKVQRSFAPCTVTVYPTGSSTPVPGNQIFSDNSSTVKGNPFTSNANGYWFFYAANGRYDVTLSGGGFPTPFTYGDILLADPAAGPGGVTSVTGGMGILATPVTGAVVVSSTSGIFEVADYVFTPQTPGGSLAIGSNVITLTPVPKGINGSDTNHKLYISGGSGTAEAVIITGGTAVSEATTGTVIVTCAHTHSGAWTIGSATAAIQEAVQACITAGGGEVHLPPGAYPLKASVVNDASAIKIRGSGSSNTSVTCLNFDAFSISSAGAHNNEVSNMTIDNAGGGTTGYAVNALNQAILSINNLTVGAPYGFKLDSCAYSEIATFLIGSVIAGGNGIYLVGTFDCVVRDGFMGNADVNNPGFAALYYEGVTAIYTENIDAIQFNKGVYIGPQGCQFLHFKAVTMAGHGTGTHSPWDIGPTSPGRVVTMTCIDCEAFDGLNDGVSLNANGGNIYGFKWIGGHIYNNGAHGFHIEGANCFDTHIVASSISGNGVTAGDEIRIGVAVTKVDIHSNIIGMADAPPADSYWNPTATRGVAIDAGAGDYINITGNRFTGGYVVEALSNNATGTHVTINNNNGIDTLVPPTIASGTSVAWPLTGVSVAYITGTTTTLTITGLSIGQTIKIIKSDTGSLIVGGGGNIPVAVTLTQNHTVTLTFDGTKLY